MQMVSGRRNGDHGNQGGNKLQRKKAQRLQNVKYAYGHRKQSLRDSSTNEYETIFILSKSNALSFSKKLSKWATILGLGEWKIMFGGFGSYSENCMASVAINHEGRIATVVVSREWPIKPTGRALSMVALHELLEITVSPMTDLIDSNHISSSTIQEASHQVIRHLETLIFGPNVETM